MPKNSALIKFLSEAGVRAHLQKTENYYLQDQGKEMPKVDAELYFTIDEKQHGIELTEKGVDLISGDVNDRSFFIMPDVGGTIAEIEKSAAGTEEKARRKDELLRDFGIKSERIHTVNQLIRAYALYEKDVEYVVMDGKVKIVDEQTGRILEGRRYSDGLHQAIESKEKVKVEAATQTYATVTLQNYFRMYHKLAGMTGTAETEAQELWDIYKLDVMVIPTNRPVVRKDAEDMVFKTKREKYNAVIDEIVALREAGRPVLVGTTSVEVSELVSRMLKLRNIPHNVLNAKQHQREAEIVAARRPVRHRDHRHEHGRSWYRHQARARGEGGRWSRHHRYREAREPPRGPPVARPCRPPGRPRIIPVLRIAGGRPDAPVQQRAHRQADGPPGPEGGRGDPAQHGHGQHRTRAEEGGGEQLRHPETPAGV